MVLSLIRYEYLKLVRRLGRSAHQKQKRSFFYSKERLTFMRDLECSKAKYRQPVKF